jgi:lipoyl(octanoyl) transferase
MLNKYLIIKHFQKIVNYEQTYLAMQKFTQQRDINSLDQIWLVEHYPIYTLGINKLYHNILDKNISIYETDRGGQVTYHGLGQLVIYVLIDLKRHNLVVKKFVYILEQIIIDLLDIYNIIAKRKATGIYINNAKIAFIGLKIKRGCSYHGISLNVNMDLKPFNKINPCGYKNLEITQLSNFIKNIKIDDILPNLINILLYNLQYEYFILKTIEKSANIS